MSLRPVRSSGRLLPQRWEHAMADDPQQPFDWKTLWAPKNRPFMVMGAIILLLVVLLAQQMGPKGSDPQQQAANAPGGAMSASAAPNGGGGVAQSGNGSWKELEPGDSDNAPHHQYMQAA